MTHTKMVYSLFVLLSRTFKVIYQIIEFDNLYIQKFISSYDFDAIFFSKIMTETGKGGYFQVSDLNIHDLK